MSTPESQPPTLKSVQKVTSIPLINDGLTYAHNTLSQNTYTQRAYNTAQSISLTAFRVTQPIQARLAPIIQTADGLAAKGLDVVESKFPYPFHVQTDEVLGSIKSQTDHAYKAFDSNVKSPAYGIASNVDSSLTPIVDRFDTLVQKIGSSKPNSPTSTPTSLNGSAETQPNGATTQVGRAYRLSLDLKDQIYTLSGEQIKQLQSQSVIVQRATDTIYNLSQSLQSTYTSARETTVSVAQETTTRLHAISSAILSELDKVQHSTASLPSQIQSSFQPLTQSLSQTSTEISEILKSDVPAGEKVNKIGEKVKGLLEGGLRAFRGKAEEVNGDVRENVNRVNGKH